MKCKLVFIVLLGCALVGCFASGKVVFETDRYSSKMLCEVGKDRVSIMRRFSFDVPQIFKNSPCGTVSSGFTYDKLGDSVSIGTAGVFYNGNVASHTARYAMSFEGFNGRRLETLVAREDFSEYILARGALSPILGRPDRVERVQVGSNDCDRHTYLPKKSNIGGWVEKIGYWCWEKQSGLSIPFHIEASQRQEQESDGINMEKEFIQQFFDSLQINHLSGAEVELINRNRREVCEDQKRRFDESRMAGDDYPDQRLLKTRLHYCGYDFPLPDLGKNL
ncbi:hypothetical protein [Pseudomonas nitroreducens]|uniref:hypothetical protein n=1 Tax=Pseudomonas nitroreducens TaxID=46680 RepID=UPI002D7FB4B0|nr:hypothetical protein [Pseudomonas nitroreducens]